MILGIVVAVILGAIFFGGVFKSGGGGGNAPDINVEVPSAPKVDVPGTK